MAQNLVTVARALAATPMPAPPEQRFAAVRIGASPRLDASEVSGAAAAK